MALILELLALTRGSIPLVIVIREVSKEEIAVALDTLEMLTAEGTVDTSWMRCLFKKHFWRSRGSTFLYSSHG